jgi:hypothetical protein
MNRTLEGMHMQNPPHSLDAAVHEFVTRKIGANALRLFAHSEETRRCAIANTRLPHGHANDLCQQRLGELAHLGMLFDDGGQRTSEASDDDFITRVLQLRQTAEILQDVNCDFQTLAKLSLRRNLGKRSPKNARKTPANVAQQLAFLCRGDSGFQ